MTRDRMLEIVAAMRSPEGCACSLSEMSDAFLMLADLAGIGQPADVDLDSFEARALAALDDVPDPRALGWRRGSYDVECVFVPYADALEGPNGERVLLRMNERLPHEKAAAHIAGAHPAAMLVLVALVRRERARADTMQERCAEVAARAAGSEPHDDADERVLQVAEAIRALGLEP